MVKLTDKNIKWIIRHAEIQKDETTKSISLMYKISQRRVQQLRNTKTQEKYPVAQHGDPKQNFQTKIKK
jgi:hypothetical protein